MTQPYIDAGDLIVIGLVQEQHPERAQLYAQWQQLDWPILWDPFNTTGAVAVPNAYLIDEHGILQGKRLNEEALAAFMEAEFEAPDEPVPTSESTDRLYQAQTVDGPRPDPLVVNPPQTYWQLISDAMWHRDTAMGSGISLVRFFSLVRFYSSDRQISGFDYFADGVLYRMRYDSDEREEDDFQAAIDAWAKALELDPTNTSGVGVSSSTGR